MNRIRGNRTVHPPLGERPVPPAGECATRPLAARAAGTVLLVAALLASGLAGRASASAFGTLSNFDVVNDTPTPCHGFEIELEDIHPSDVPYTFGGSYTRYGSPEVVEDAADPAHPRVIVRYRRWNGSGWEATPVAPPNVTPSGHDCFAGGPVGNYLDSGCEHYGVSLSAQPTKTTYRWLVADDPANPSTTFSTVPQAVQIPVPVWSVIPPAAPGAVVVVRAELEPVEEEAHAQFGEPQWMRVFKIQSELDLGPEDLNRLLLGVADDILPDETEIETEWKLIQSKPGDAEGEEEDAEVKEDPLDDGKRSVIRRYEFYAYTGPRDPENGEAMPCIDDDQPVPADDPLDGCTDIGDFVGAQNVAVDVSLALVDGDLPPREVGVAGPPLGLVLGGVPPYAVVAGGAGLPAGLTLDPSTGALAGTPASAGTFDFSVHAEDAVGDSADGEFTITIVPPVAIDTAALPVAVSGECYSASVTASGGLAPFVWADIAESLPAWAYSENNDDIAGCPGPGEEGLTQIAFAVTDSLGGTSTEVLDLLVIAPTEAPTEDPTATPTPTRVDTATETPTAIDTATATPTEVDTATATPTAIDTPTATSTAGDTSTPEPTATPDPPTATPADTETVEPTATETPAPELTATPTGTATAPAEDTPTPKGDKPDRPARPDLVRGAGRITAVGSNYVVIGKVRVYLDPETRIRFDGVSSLRVGYQARYWGRRTEDGAVHARGIVVRGAGAPEKQGPHDRRFVRLLGQRI